MIDFLVEQGIDPNTTTLVGHSLGAHIMGLAGYYAKEKVNFVYGKYVQKYCMDLFWWA